MASRILIGALPAFGPAWVLFGHAATEWLLLITLEAALAALL